MKHHSGDKENLIFNLRSREYHGTLPLFYSPDDFPELNVLKNNWQVIFREIQDYESEYGSISGINTLSPPGLSSTNAWNNIYLENFLWQFHVNRKHFPETCKVLAQIPGCTLAVITVLSPQGSIEPHYGDTNAVIRCHLGLQIPAPYPACGIRVGNQEQGWKNGELTVFSEAHYHHVWNRTNEKRYLLVVDIVHPQWSREKEWICARVLGAQSYIFFEKRIPFLQKLPYSFLAPIHLVFSLIWRAYLPIQRKMAFLY